VIGSLNHGRTTASQQAENTREAVDEADHKNIPHGADETH
jgi:hypothetical protein